MTTLYLWDKNYKFTSTKEVPAGVRYSNSTEIAPPVGIAIPHWKGTAVGWGEYVAPKRTYLNVVTNKVQYALDEVIQVTADLKVGTDLVPLDAKYYVPVIRVSDGKQAAFITVTFVKGEANASFSITESGKYTIHMDKITPTPSANVELAANIELLVI